MKGKEILSPAARLIVAADFKPTSVGLEHEQVFSQVMNLCKELEGTGVCIKINSAHRAHGHDLIARIQYHGLKVFADLKLHDIPETLSMDGLLLNRMVPDFVTVCCAAGVDGMRALKAELPDTEVLGVTVLTTLSTQQVFSIHGGTVEGAVLELARMAAEAGVDGLISSPQEATMLRGTYGSTLSLNTPGIRPSWVTVPKDDQRRVMTPAEAIEAGADRIVVGRPITLASDRKEAVMKTIEEIKLALAT